MQHVVLATWLATILLVYEPLTRTLLVELTLCECGFSQECHTFGEAKYMKGNLFDLSIRSKRVGRQISFTGTLYLQSPLPFWPVTIEE